MKNPYKLCIIEKPFDSAENTQQKNFFGHLLALRMEGYSAVHGKGVIPIDPYDYFATNILLYKEISGEIVPVACSRIIRYSDCIANNLVFPPLNLLDHRRNKNTADEILRMIETMSKEGKEITFDSSFAIAPLYKCSSESNLIIKNIMGSVFHWHNENNANTFLASATIKVKTDRLFERLGLSPVANDSSYKLQSVNNEPALMMKFTESPTKRTKKWMESCTELWTDRIQSTKHSINKETCAHVF